MSWLNSSVPVWQLFIAVTLYVLYRELVKFSFKRVMRLFRRSKVSAPQISSPDTDIPRQ